MGPKTSSASNCGIQFALFSILCLQELRRNRPCSERCCNISELSKWVSYTNFVRMGYPKPPDKVHIDPSYSILFEKSFYRPVLSGIYEFWNVQKRIKTGSVKRLPWRVHNGYSGSVCRSAVWSPWNGRHKYPGLGTYDRRLRF